jgi:hypothetical protein
VGEQEQEQELLGSLLLQQSYLPFKQNMEEQDRERELLVSMVLQGVILRSNRTWKIRIRNRNFWGPASATELSFIQAKHGRAG